MKYDCSDMNFLFNGAITFKQHDSHRLPKLPTELVLVYYRRNSLRRKTFLVLPGIMHTVVQRLNIVPKEQY
jgi:hypothetical protein